MNTEKFPGACRLFLTELAEFAESPDEALHVASCSKCAARLAAARRSIALLRRLGRPEIPTELSEPAFLEGVYERATAASEAAVGPLLAASIASAQAPGDAVWHEVDEGSGVAEHLRGLLSERASPGWVWARIRARLREESGPRPRGVRRVRRWSRVAAAAAAVLIVGLVLRSRLHAPENHGTPPVPGLVWLDEAEPLDPSLSPVGIVRELAR